MRSRAMTVGAEYVHACLSVSGIGRAKLPVTVKHVVMVRDDDPPGSTACQALGRGVARLMLQGRPVRSRRGRERFSAGAKDIADLSRATPLSPSSCSKTPAR